MQRFAKLSSLSLLVMIAVYLIWRFSNKKSSTYKQVKQTSKSKNSLKLDAVVLKENVLPSLTIDDLKELRLINRKLGEDLGPVLQQRKHKHEIHQIIQEIAQAPAMTNYFPEFVMDRTQQITNQCIDGFTGWIRDWECGKACAQLEALLENVIRLQRLLSDYRKQYGFDQKGVEGFEEFVSLHRQNQKFIHDILKVCEEDDDVTSLMQEHLVNSDLLFEVIARKIGYTVNGAAVIDLMLPVDKHKDENIDSMMDILWKYAFGGFQGLKRSIALDPQELAEKDEVVRKLCALFKGSNILIDEFLKFLQTVRMYTATTANID